MKFSTLWLGLATLFVLFTEVICMPAQQLKEQLQQILAASVQLVGEKTKTYGPYEIEMKVMGSGTVIRKNNKAYIVTAAHVVEFLKEEVTYVDEVEEKEKKRVIYRDAWVVLERVKDGRKVGEIRLLAKVRFCSKVEEEGGDDIAVLEVYDSEFLPVGVSVLPKGVEVWIGQRCWHVGSLLGSFVNSLAEGNISAVGRLINDKPFNQIAGSAMPGSSGGGVFVEHDGQIYYAGMITRGAGETVNFFVPIERMREALLKAPDEIKGVLD